MINYNSLEHVYLAFLSQGHANSVLRQHSSQILNSHLPLPNKGDAQAVVYRYFYGPPAINISGYKSAITVRAKSFRM
jgi:hypothetical protein